MYVIDQHMQVNYTYNICIYIIFNSMKLVFLG